MHRRGRLLVQRGILRLDLRSAAAWAWCPATGLLVVAFLASPWPLRLRVEVSEAALMRAVEQVEAGHAPLALPVRTGLFEIDGVMVRPGAVLLVVNEGCPLESQGLAYVRDDAIWRGAERIQRPPFTGRISGRWWWFRYPD